MITKNKLGKLLVVMLCIVLAVFMTVEVAHNDHANPAGSADSSHCQLCAAAHIAIDTQPTWMTAYVLRLIERISIGEPAPGSIAVIVTGFIRPPPVSL